MTGNGPKVMQKEQFGHPREIISLKEAESWINFGLENKFEYIQIAWCANGLGPKHQFNYHKLRLRKDDYTPPDEWCITEIDYNYLKLAYHDKIGIY